MKAYFTHDWGLAKRLYRCWVNPICVCASSIAHNLEGHCKHDTARHNSGRSSMSIPVWASVTEYRIKGINLSLRRAWRVDPYEMECHLSHIKINTALGPLSLHCHTKSSLGYDMDVQWLVSACHCFHHTLNATTYHSKRNPTFLNLFFASDPASLTLTPGHAHFVTKSIGKMKYTKKVHLSTKDV